jgi:hypothetical protein
VKLLKTLDAYNDPTDTDISSHLSTLTLTEVQKETWRNWWDKKKTIYDLAESVGMTQPYRIQYGALSSLIHSAPLGISFYIHGKDDVVSVDWKANSPAPQSIAGAETFIAGAATYMLDVIRVLAKIYDLDYDADLRTAGEAIRKFNEQ